MLLACFSLSGQAGRLSPGLGWRGRPSMRGLKRPAGLPRKAPEAQCLQHCTDAACLVSGAGAGRAQVCTPGHGAG